MYISTKVGYKGGLLRGPFWHLWHHFSWLVRISLGMFTAVIYHYFFLEHLLQSIRKALGLSLLNLLAELKQKLSCAS